MIRNLRATTRSPANGLSQRRIALYLPVLVTLVLFVFSARSGGAITDPSILTLVRFLSVITLSLGVFTCIFMGMRYAHSHKMWAAGQISGACMGIGAGFFWSATAYGAGFSFFMLGLLLIVLLIMRELQKSNLRRRLACESARSAV